MGANASQPYIHPPTIKVGTYTGNGAATQAITGVGFHPDSLLVGQHRDANSPSLNMKTAAMTDNVLQAAINGWFRADIVISLDADGFTVGDGELAALNVNGLLYSYIALKGI